MLMYAFQGLSAIPFQSVQRLVTSQSVDAMSLPSFLNLA
jgi:hypothetical protein